MIEKIFCEIKNEARESNIVLVEDSIQLPIRVGFNVVEETISNNLPNFYIQNNSNFYKLLTEYVLTAIDFYGFDKNYNDIKKIMTFMWSNITNDEMNFLENFIKKYINFMNDTILPNKKGSKNTSLGQLFYEVTKQSIKQETPYCFKAHFEDLNTHSKFALPRISFGIDGGICYIYAIQNKDSKINTDSIYNLKVKNSFNKINSSIKKYRNITPSFIVVLSLFLSFLYENNIYKVKVESPLPIRIQNRKLVTEYKIRFETMSGTLSKENLEIFKKELEDKRILNDYNSSIKFINCFNRLKIHFDNLFLRKCKFDSGILLEIIDLQTKYDLLREVVKIKDNKEKER